MMTINGKDAYSTWGVRLEKGAYSVLTRGAAAKEYITNTSRLEDGDRIIPLAKLASREIQLPMSLTASSTADMTEKMAAFLEEVSKGKVVIYEGKYTKKYYRCVYRDFMPVADNINGLSLFTLKLTEPDPTDRGEESKHANIWTDETEE